jgi:hypothetical protein
VLVIAVIVVVWLLGCALAIVLCVASRRTDEEIARGGPPAPAPECPRSASVRATPR